MKNPTGVKMPATKKTQFSSNPDSEPHVVNGDPSNLYKPGNGGLNVKKGPNAEKTQYSNN